MRSSPWVFLMAVLLVSGCGKQEEKPALAPSKELVPPVAVQAPPPKAPEAAVSEKPAPLSPTQPIPSDVIPIAAPPSPPLSVAPQPPPQEKPSVTSTVAAALAAAEAKRAALLGQASAPASIAVTPGSRTEGAASPSALATLSLSDLSQDQVTRGLKEALGRGLQQAIGSLGTSGGFLTNLAVKIPMPEKLQSIEKTLRALRQDRLADEFVTTMNQAAEKAVPAAAEVFAGTLKRMSVEDAKRILSGSADAATQYFRKANTAELTEKFLPIVQQATGKSGATAAFKQLMDKASLAAPFTKVPVVDLDGYVTEKALDGLFTLVAAEEKHIRENPVARTTDLLKSVFGALKK